MGNNEATMNPEVLKVSELKDPTEDELDYAADLLLEAEKIEDNDELFKAIINRAKARGEKYLSIQDLKDKAEEMSETPKGKK